METNHMTITRAARLLAVGLAALAFGACGGGEASSQDDPEVIVPEETAVPYEGYESVDGLLETAHMGGVVLVRPNGERIVFRVREQNLPTIGLEHLASHAGVTDIGFRVYYEQKGKRRFIIGAEEIPPPTG
jgi:hypothetical protein